MIFDDRESGNYSSYFSLAFATFFLESFGGNVI